eukprot:TRINITY_DN30013_c0_g1_i3.p1 TRINITY_DN30013_c0_g1~~TRINITY_DN30013_c0_g1_i3.p1  ORF type:complete len:363 (-),score=90.48 TRINITY_DN30013_c0_g1_i3:663-1751(-)
MEGITRQGVGFLGGIGHTPLILLKSLSEFTGCKIYGKAEYLNPGGSVKDRPAKYMVEAAEKEGLLKPGGWIVEGTAGNTGVGLCCIANTRGYKCLFVCPNKVSNDKIELLRMLGAMVEVVPMVPSDHENFFWNVAQRRAKELNGLFTNQFDNPHNMQAHYETTGPEIWEQTYGTIDALVMGCGTGGTIGGCSKFLREKNPKIKVFLSDSQNSALKFSLNEEKNEIRITAKSPEEKKQTSKDSVIEGVGSGRVYFALEQLDLDGVLLVPDQIAVEMSHFLMKNEGFFVGGSSGLNVVGALWLAKHLGPGHTIVTVLTDTGHNYRNNSIFSSEWLHSKGITCTRYSLQEFFDAFHQNSVHIQRK